MTTPRMERTHVETVLQDMEVGGWPGVYVLGCLDRRVTVYSQQVRALNLAAALVEGKKVGPGDRVVVTSMDRRSTAHANASGWSPAVVMER